MAAFDLLLYTLGILLSMVVGALGYAGSARRRAQQKRRLPRQLALDQRRLVTEPELQVWTWLEQAFPEHRVLVKLSVLRFTTSRNAGRETPWHELLNGLYCTFTVCDRSGRVAGCVDVPTERGLRHRAMKQQILAACNVPYAVVRATDLPSLDDIRIAFLGESDSAQFSEFSESHTGATPPASAVGQPAAQSVRELSDFESADTVPDTMRAANGAILSDDLDMEAIAAARKSLRAKLEQNRKIRFTNFDPLATGGGIVPESGGDDFAVQWEDSYIGGLEEEPEAQRVGS